MVSTPIPPERRKSALRLRKDESGDTLLGHVSESPASITAAHAQSFNTLYTDRGRYSQESSTGEVEYRQWAVSRWTKVRIARQAPLTAPPESVPRPSPRDMQSAPPQSHCCR